MKRKLSVWVMVVFVVVVQVTWAATNAEKIIKSVQNLYKNAKTARIDFNETDRFKLTGVTSSISGTLIFKGLALFRLETEDQVIVSNGSIFWRYNKLENQVLIDYAKKGQQEVFLNQFLYQISDHYFSRLVDTIDEGKKKTFVINLTPKVPEQSYFTAIKVWVQEKTWYVSKILYIDYNGNETEYDIERIEIDIPVPDSTFEFQPPEGSEIVDLRFE